jgi:hypothetical protein
MLSKLEQDLKRQSLESSALTTAAHSSCNDTYNHIKASRGLIARSLELLSQRFSRVD